MSNGIVVNLQQWTRKAEEKDVSLVESLRRPESVRFQCELLQLILPIYTFEELLFSPICKRLCRFPEDVKYFFLAQKVVT